MEEKVAHVPLHIKDEKEDEADKEELEEEGEDLQKYHYLNPPYLSPFSVVKTSSKKVLTQHELLPTSGEGEQAPPTCYIYPHLTL